MWVLQVKLQGIPGIRKVFMRELKTTHLDQDGIYQTENQWVLDTEGVNLLDVSNIALPATSVHFVTHTVVMHNTCLYENACNLLLSLPRLAQLSPNDLCFSFTYLIHGYRSSVSE